MICGLREGKLTAEHPAKCPVERRERTGSCKGPGEKLEGSRHSKSRLRMENDP